MRITAWRLNCIKDTVYAWPSPEFDVLDMNAGDMITLKTGDVLLFTDEEKEIKHYYPLIKDAFPQAKTIAKPSISIDVL